MEWPSPRLNLDLSKPVTSSNPQVMLSWAFAGGAATTHVVERPESHVRPDPGEPTSQ